MRHRDARPSIVIAKPDYQRLSDLADAAPQSSQAAGYLADVLDRASVVESDEVAADTVTMHSRLVFRDDARGETLTVSLVYPGEENIDDARISVLTPIGAALLGLSEGQSIEWATRHGEPRTLTVLKVLSQPSRASLEVEAASR
jgi:regulator of nucleoside diphosphate kinase